MITLNQVSKSYNGKSGCMCGCNGTYSLPSHVTVEEANRSVGYEGYDESDVSNRRVNIAVNKINAALTAHENKLVDGEYRSGGFVVGINDDHAYVDNGIRNTVVYF